jgi:hypothetical protein
MEILWLVVIGFTAGTLGSMLGLGGGFLVVPALILLHSLEEKVAAGTAVAVIVPTMLVALWRHGANGNVQWSLVGGIAVGAVAGAFLGPWLADVLPGIWLRRIFAFVLVGLAGILYFK